MNGENGSYEMVWGSGRREAGLNGLGDGILERAIPRQDLGVARATSLSQSLLPLSSTT